MWGAALWKLEGYIKVGHDGYQKNSFPGVEGDWNEQAVIPMCSFEMVTWVQKMDGYGAIPIKKNWPNSRHNPLTASEVQKHQ